MADPQNTDNRFEEAFVQNFLGGAFVYSADKDHRLLYVSDNLIRLFDCADIDEFMTYTGGSFDGIIHDPSPDVIGREIKMYLKESPADSGYVFFNIKSAKGNIHRVVNHWTLVHDDEAGDIFYAYLFLHSRDNAGVDYDGITGLLGKSRFDRYANDLGRGRSDSDGTEYAIIYVNLVNFKRLNIENGVAKGDECLRVISKILTKCFENSFVARISDDHFAVFSEYDGVVTKASNAEHIFYDTFGNEFSVICKMGIYRFVQSNDFDVESALSCAKIACDHIKHDKNNDIAEYSSELAEKIRTVEHVSEKIDEAIEKEWLKVYFQPVVRTLTGKLCGMESLIRWIDPELGFLPPDRFIGALENARTIHKLDSFVVRKVCACLRERMDEGKPVVPVSVNFSRLDFVLCDMLEVVEAAVAKYRIPKDHIHIEITESMIASDEKLMTKVIEDFTGAGYEIWMDDFGSGYSSLTVLKGFKFDLLKMDMNFLSPFTEKSKSIMRSVVSMAKDIGMRTLAEGVETKEQLEFLKDIGCGRIQGYYYGKPEPIDDVFKHLSKKGIETEGIEWQEFYDIAGFHARLTDVPLEIIEDDGTEFKTLFMNQSYRAQVFTDPNMTLEEIDRYTYKSGSPLIKKYQEFAHITERSGVPETFYYTVGGSYLCLTVQSIAENRGHHIIKGSIVNLSLDSKPDDRLKMDTMLKELNLLFETVQAVNLSENTIMPLLGGFKYVDRDAIETRDLQKSIEYFADNMVPEPEKERCVEFLKSSTLAGRVEESGEGYIADVFNIKQADGVYRKCEAFIMMIPDTGANEYLFCVKKCIEKRTDI